MHLFKFIIWAVVRVDFQISSPFIYLLAVVADNGGWIFRDKDVSKMFVGMLSFLKGLDTILDEHFIFYLLCILN